MTKRRATNDQASPTQRRPATTNQSSSARPTTAAPAVDKRVVVPRPARYEQRTTLPKMRVGAGRQRSLRVESKPVAPPRPPLRLPRPSLRLAQLTPARAASLILVATCLALVVFLLGAQGFYVYSAEITGNRLVSAQDIYARSGVDATNIFLIRPQQAEQRLRDVPFVKNARVTLGLPARVSIEVEERAPAALWQAAGNTYGIAEDGTVLPPEGAASGAPVIQAEGGALQYGAKVEGEVIDVAQHLQDLIPDAQRVVYSQERGVGVVTAQGWPAYFGVKDEAIAAKVAVLNALSRELKGQKLEPEYVDMRYGQRPYYKLKNAK